MDPNRAGETFLNLVISAHSLPPVRRNHAVTGKAVQVLITSNQVALEGELQVPSEAKGVVLFAHGSGSSRRSVRNRMVARTLHRAGIGTLLFDLLTPHEELEDQINATLRFNIPLLTDRLLIATTWLQSQPAATNLSNGYFGASTGAAAALEAAAVMGTKIKAVVSRGGRPDLAIGCLPQVKAPTLLIVGGQDELVLRLNEKALEFMSCEKRLEVVPRATHLFEEPGTLEEVASLAAEWFESHLRP